MAVDFTRFPHSLLRAARALVTALREELNFRLQVVGAIVVVLLAVWLRIDARELAVIFLAVAVVPVLELVNSAVERLVDMAQPRVHHYAAAVKNLMAGAVLLSAVAAGGVVLVIFWPYLVGAWPFVL